MSDTPLSLPARPSLEQLRKQAKDRLASMPDAKLADAQFALARDYGFDSWPKLVRHVDGLQSPSIAQHDRIAHDMVAAYRHSDEAAAARLNDLFHSALSVEQIQHFIRNRLFGRAGGTDMLAAFDIRAARVLVAGLYGFESWDALLDATAGAATTGAPGLSTAPPFHSIDETGGIVRIRQPMSSADWDMLIGIMRDRGLTGLEANNMMDDAALQKLAEVPGVRVLKLHGSDRLTDQGLRHLEKFVDLEEIELGGWKSPMTDAGFAALGALPRLRAVHSWWSRNLTDAGVKTTLQTCPSLEDLNFGGTSLGDGLIEAVAGKPRVWRVFCGDGVTDSGLAQLHEIPRFRRWQGERRYSLLEFEAGPTYLAAKGAFTARGLRAVAELEGLFALNLHWTTSGMTSADLGVLRDAPNLGFLAIDGDLTNDEAMRQIGALPRLNMLLAQEPVAGDEGFAGLSRSKTLEYFWARECPNLTGRGFAAMAEMPALKGLAASCKFVDDNALALLPRFPALRALMPMDVTDDGFRHVGRCERLEELWCMYCRETGDKATEQIADLKLKSYYAGHTQITDHSLDVLSRMTTLARIHLYGCHGITDAGVHRLTALPHLRHLSMEGCRNLTRAAAAGFGSQVRVNYSAI
jgi:hypothetical protein